MIVQILGNSQHLDDLPFLQAIVETVHDSGAVIAHDWVSAAERTHKNGGRGAAVDWEEQYKENIEAISRADIVVAEATAYGFTEGFYVSQALNQKKPVLIVSHKDIKTLPISGAGHKLLQVQHYDNAEELQKLVAKFIKINTIATKDLRFNFFIDRQIYNYLREASYETGKNKSEIIRELLEEEIDKQERS